MEVKTANKAFFSRPLMIGAAVGTLLALSVLFDSCTAYRSPQRTVPGGSIHKTGIWNAPHCSGPTCSRY